MVEHECFLTSLNHLITSLDWSVWSGRPAPPHPTHRQCVCRVRPSVCYFGWWGVGGRRETAGGRTWPPCLRTCLSERTLGRHGEEVCHGSDAVDRDALISAPQRGTPIIIIRIIIPLIIIVARAPVCFTVKALA
jgi:hypothetical protein